MCLRFKLILPMLICVLAVTGNVWAVSPDYGHEKNDYVYYLRTRMTAEAMEPWRGGAPMVTVADIESYLWQLNLWATVARDAQKHKLSAEEEAMLLAFKTRAKAIQAEMFPKLRWALANVPPEGYGKTDVVLHTEGESARQAVFTGRKLSQDDDARFFDDRLYRLLQQLRFESACYEVAVKGKSRTESILLENQPPDDFLVIWNVNTGRLRIVE